MNDVALSGNGGALAETQGQGNFFEQYAEAASQKSITGRLLKFSKGDWLVDSKEIPVNTSLVANMDNLMVGWVRWANSKPTDHVMGKVAQGYKPPLRSSLGDHDEATWERDPQTNKPKDPWQLTNYLVLQEPVGERNLFTFTTSSKGGLSAIGDLCRSYGSGARMRPAEFPIVALRVDSYLHPDKAYGRIKTPVLTIVGWSPKADFEAEPEAAAATQADADTSGRSARGSSDYAPATATKF